jgi:hypothetical protein
MGKYDALEHFFKNSSSQSLTLNFSEIEEIIGATLPQSAHVHSAWWANDNSGSHPHAVWLVAGWKVVHADRRAQQVLFERL